MMDIHIVNPNSLGRVTASIRAAVEPVLAGLPAQRVYATLEDAPPGITSQASADIAATLVARYVTKHKDLAGAFILACFSDPGVFAARELTQLPVFGIGHQGLLAAMEEGKRVGVIAITESSIARHWRYWRGLELAQHVVQERALELPVEHSGDLDIALERMISVGRQLMSSDGADVLLLGCAGMAALRPMLEERLQIPVIDPCQAAARAVFQSCV